MIGLLGLPEYTFPIADVAIGYVEQPATQNALARRKLPARRA